MLLAGAAGALALAVAGCGGGSKGATSQGTRTKLGIKAAPDDKLKFNVDVLQARAGKVTITMANPSQLTHSVAIEGNGVDVEGRVVGPGGTSMASAALKPGTYTYYCTVPGHRQAGMQGTLTVR